MKKKIAFFSMTIFLIYLPSRASVILHGSGTFRFPVLPFIFNLLKEARWHSRI
ncbi:hypothetical protein ESA_02988 [Cronobacter sakazakii ATCC BAA-894]|uniref:Uncharacterized protein n=1 Tax=Cronobacter sakazakii (strain ATCC BAA-894) TaxID=290339 RepID=A7MN68_CROS8|nr:hypothetical protein ESA_02988 [Cronobacter sakazakii ATCC BAA-894]